MTNHPNRNRSKQQQPTHTPFYANANEWNECRYGMGGPAQGNTPGWYYSNPEDAEHFIGPFQSQADARIHLQSTLGLIAAAAPETAAERDRLKALNAELLAALKDALEYIVGYAESADADDPCHEMLRRWQALIAKARGR